MKENHKEILRKARCMLEKFDVSILERGTGWWTVDDKKRRCDGPMETVNHAYEKLAEWFDADGYELGKFEKKNDIEKFL